MSWWTNFFTKIYTRSTSKQDKATVEFEADYKIVKHDSEISEDDPRIAEGQEQIRAFWQSIGELETDLLSYIVNPQFLGAPSWPNTRQAFAVIRTETSLIIASDGLSDPFVGSSVIDQSGYGIEVFIEIEGLQDVKFDEIISQPEFSVIEMVARNVAGHGGIAKLIDEIGILSMSLPLDCNFEDDWVDNEGQLGVLLGMNSSSRSKRLELPFGTVRILAVTPLRPDEIQAVARSTEARNKVAASLSQSATEHRFCRNRASVV